MIVAVDMGRAGIKYWGGVPGGGGMFPARAIPLNGMPVDLIGTDRMQVKVQDKEWFVGQTALEQGTRMVTGRRHQDYVLSDAWKALLFTAISELVSPNTNEVEVDLVLGLPFQDYGNHKDLQSIAGIHVIGRPGRRNLKANIRNVLVAPQCYVAVANIKGEGMRAGVDLGGYTTGISTFKGTKVFGGTELNRSNSEGTLGVLEAISSELSKVLKTSFTVFEVAEMAANNNFKIKVGGKVYDIGKFAHPKLQGLADTTYRFVSESLGDFYGRTEISMFGGGVLALKHVINNDSRFEDWAILDDPVFANAKALYNMGRLKYGK